MKKHLLTFSLLLLSVCLFSVKTVAQRDAGGYSIGKDSVLKQKLTNYPNSFNTSTIIKYDVPADGTVIIKIYNAAGQEITTLIDGEIKAGSYSIEYNALNLSSGMYICRYAVLADKKVSVLTHKLSVIK